MDGVYAIGGLGSHGFVMATWIFVQKRMFGYDIRGNLYDGSYEDVGDTRRCWVELKTSSPESNFIEGPDGNRVINFELTLEESLFTGIPTLISTPSGAMQVSITRVRSL